MSEGRNITIDINRHGVHEVKRIPVDGPRRVSISIHRPRAASPKPAAPRGPAPVKLSPREVRRHVADAPKNIRINIHRPSPPRARSPKPVRRPSPPPPKRAVSPPKRRVSPPKRRVSPPKRVSPKKVNAKPVHHHHAKVFVQAPHKVHHPIVTHAHKGLMYHDSPINLAATAPGHSSFLKKE